VRLQTHLLSKFCARHLYIKRGKELNYFGRRSSNGPENAAWEAVYTMSKGRMEAFSDGVLAVIITIMVLEMKSPVGARLTALRPVVAVFLSYVLSFVYIGIYWNNHHHLLHATQHINGSTLWANLHLLFWLSLVPFTTAWMGENHFTTWPVALYGTVLLLAATAYFILTRTLISLHGRGSTLARSIGSDMKGKFLSLFTRWRFHLRSCSRGSPAPAM